MLDKRGEVGQRGFRKKSSWVGSIFLGEHFRDDIVSPWLGVYELNTRSSLPHHHQGEWEDQRGGGRRSTIMREGKGC
jgi:hypothetical protein